MLAERSWRDEPLLFAWIVIRAKAGITFVARLGLGSRGNIESGILGCRKTLLQ